MAWKCFKIKNTWNNFNCFQEAKTPVAESKITTFLWTLMLWLQRALASESTHNKGGGGEGTFKNISISQIFAVCWDKCQCALLTSLCDTFLAAAAHCHKKNTTDQKIVNQVTEWTMYICLSLETGSSLSAGDKWSQI